MGTKLPVYSSRTTLYLSNGVEVCPADGCHKRFESAQSIEELSIMYMTSTKCWIALMWNNYRLARTILYTDILSALTNNFLVNHSSLMQRCVEVLKTMTTGTVRSVPYHLVCSGIELETSEATVQEQSQRSLAGSYLLIWPLFVAGGIRTTSAELREWTARTLL